MPVSRPRAMVYRGPAALVGCSEAVADMLVASPRNFEVIYAGHNEAVNVSAENLSKVDLYVQPGGADLEDAWGVMECYAKLIRDFIANGGRYLGICLGAYLAGRDPGWGLLPPGVDTDSEIEANGTQVTHDKDTVIQVDWTWASGPKAGTTTNHWLYFQEGSRVEGLVESKDAFVMGRYSKSGGVAASVSRYGKGWIGLMGPHPEANQDWYDLENLTSPDGLHFDIGYDLLEALMTGRREVRPKGSSQASA